MTKNRLFFIIVALILLSPLSLLAQHGKMVRIGIEPLDCNWDFVPKNAYLMTQDTIVSKVPVYENRATFYVADGIDDGKTYVVIKENDQQCYRILMKWLAQSVNTVRTAHLKISLLEEIRLAEHGKWISSDGYHTKLWLDFTPESQMKLQDTIRWFFPTEIMLNVDVQKETIRNGYYIQNYYKEFGRYPTEGELDTLAKSMSLGAAEELIGWYSWHLLRLKENELCNGTLNDIYRFTMISNSNFYKYEPYSIRIVPYKNGTAIMYCSYEKYDECEGKELYCDIVPIGVDDYSRFQNFVKQMRFWEAKPTENPNDLYKTKKTNILEANIEGKYHVIFRGDGEDEGMDELRRFLWDLTGLGENKIVHKRQRIE